MNAAPIQASDLDIIRRVAKTYIAPRWRAFGLSLLCAAAFAALQGLLLSTLAPIINGFAFPKPGALDRLPLLIVIMAVGRTLAAITQSIIANRIGNGVVADVQIELFRRMVRADLARLRASHTGEFVSSVLFDAGLIRESATVGLLSFVQQGLALIGAGVVMAWYDWQLTLLVLIGAPLITWIFRRYSKRTAKATVGVMQATSSLSTAVMESLDGVRVVKMENREDYEERRVGAVIRERQRFSLSGDNARSFAAPFSELVVFLIIAAVIVYLTSAAKSASFDPGAAAAFLVALLAGGQSLRAVANLATVIAGGVPAARRLFKALDVAPQIGDPPGTPSLPASEGRLRLEHVSFGYSAGVPVLDRVSLEANPGETVALVGPSGAGKTTVLNLIPRFYDVTGGAVTIDGRDIRHVTMASLRAQIALVTQEPFLFDDTVGANIAYSRDGATAAEIEAAARAAAVHEFIETLPKGYDTLVGEAGTRFSGGQRQRIAIARAFLKDAPILLLDEATSALDAESEAKVHEALVRLMKGRTTVLIAHRLSTVRNADRIYVLNHGQVVETGDHASLMARKGLYSRLARGQDLEVAAEPVR